MRIVIVITTPDELIEKEWAAATSEGEITMSLAAWRDDYVAGIRDDVLGVDLREGVEFSVTVE